MYIHKSHSPRWAVIVTVLRDGWCLLAFGEWAGAYVKPFINRDLEKHLNQIDFKSRPACQKGEFILSVQLQLPAIVSHRIDSNNQIPNVKQTRSQNHQNHTRTCTHIHTEGKKAKLQTWPCLCWPRFHYWGISWYNTKCPKGLHYGDKANSCAGNDGSHRFLTRYKVQFVCTIASSQLILLPGTSHQLPVGELGWAWNTRITFSYQLTHIWTS